MSNKQPPVQNGSMDWTPFSVAILGAGPAGLTLARLLELNNIPYHIFERDTSPEVSRNRGGTLDLHPKSGQLALKAAGLHEEFRKLARYEAQELKVFGSDGGLLMHRPYVGQEDDPEIDRKDLRDLLLKSIPDERISWGMSVEEVKRYEDGEVGLKFKDGSRVTGYQLVVGADGGWSHVRKLVTSAVPEYSGIHYLQTSITKCHPKYEELYSKINGGSLVAIGCGKQISAQVLSDGTINVYVGLHLLEDWTKTTEDLKDPTAFRQILFTDEFVDWSEDITAFLKASEGPFFAWPLYTMSTKALDWQSVPGIALIGDAAHVSTPFVGEGVNVAMHDSLQLVETLLKFGPKNVDGAVKEYEGKMFVRARDLLERSKQSGDLTFAKDSPKGFKEAVLGMQSGEREKMA